jgi:hypothetical protein
MKSFGQRTDVFRSIERSSVRIMLAAAVFILNGCESSNYAPPVTPQMASATSSTIKRVDAATLDQGRTLFVHRCIECHTLPSTWHYTVDDWTQIVDRMAPRANLKKTERDAIIAYIRAVRGQK